ncbi:MAG: arsenate reductase family protein [Leptospiraceae bacterium]|nr:MAG: arsenate reductase family protein [Leptospiraceae bacterium]
MLEFYGYNKCNTSRKVESHLKNKGIEYEFIDITQKPPSKIILNQLLKSTGLQPQDLINKSSTTYRELNLKDQIKNLKKEEILKLLIENPKLIKRPVIVDKAKNLYAIGKEAINLF